MTSLRMAWILRTLSLGLCLPASVRAATPTVAQDLTTLKTFSVMGKEEEILDLGKEVELLKRDGKGCLTHMWFALDERVRIRVYVDGEKQASIDMALDLGHGYGFGGPPDPFGSPKMGRYGGQFNNYQIPYGNGVRVTVLPVTKVFDSVTGRNAWWTIRGTENLPLVVGGRRLPDTARLRLHSLEGYKAKQLEEFTLCDVKGAGSIYQVTMAVQGERKSGDWKDLGYMEGCVRAYLNGSAKPEYLSSGLEDYFLGSGYFHQNQLYFGPVAGLTHVDKMANNFSAYRFHDDDPVFFQTGLKLTCRCGEEIKGRVFHDPGSATYSVYTWVYEWPPP